MTYDLDLKKMSDIKVELLQSYLVCWKNKMLDKILIFNIWIHTSST